ncbi:MAG: hypothetical protein ACKKL5_00920 [Candidatus Komeilibacteria bacterium]
MTRLRKDLLSKLGFKIAIFEDQESEMAAARHAVEAMGLIPVPMHRFNDFNDFSINNDSLLIGVLADIHIAGVPEGLGLITNCLQYDIPVCAVTYVKGHDLDNWKGPLVQLLKQQGVIFFTSKVDGYKEWTAALESLADQIHDKLMSRTDHLAQAYQRYDKFVPAQT